MSLDAPLLNEDRTAMRQRTVLSAGWWILVALIAIYFILTSVNFNNVSNVHGLDKNTRGFDTAVMGATMTAAIFAIVYAVMTGFTLLGRWCSADTQIGSWYGVSVAGAFFLAGNFLQAGLVSYGYYDKAQLMQPTHYWSLTDTNFLRGVYVLAYIICIVLFVYGWILLFCRKAFGLQFSARRPAYPEDYEASVPPEIDQA